MSTHRDEINHFQKTVHKMGGNMVVHLDENGHCDSISTSNIENLKDLSRVSPIAAMEALRPVVGPTASQAKYSKTIPGAVGVFTFVYDESQGMCYGGLDNLVNMLNANGTLWEGEKFAATIESDDGKYLNFYCLEDGDLLKFNSLQELKQYEIKPAILDSHY